MSPPADAGLVELDELPAEALDASALLESDDEWEEPFTGDEPGEEGGAGGAIHSFGTDWSDLMSPGAQAERDAEYQSRLHQRRDAPDAAPQTGPAPIAFAPLPMAWVALPVLAGGHLLQPGCAPPAGGHGASAADLDAQAQEYMAVARRLREVAEEVLRAAGEAEVFVGTTGCALPANLVAGRGPGLMHQTICEEVPQTTVMLRNLPNDYSREMLLDLMEEEGFAACFDFLYLPIDFKRKAGLGYAFVNLVDHEVADRFRQHFDGFAKWRFASQKVCEATWGTPLQGLAQHIERYRNSPLMHPDVPDEYKPAIFEQGHRVSFPTASKRVRPPRVKFQSLRGGRAGDAMHL